MPDTAAATALSLFDETVDVADFVTWTEWALARVGFRPTNCLAVVAVCRDELMSPVEQAIEAVWGRAFQVGSLAGMVIAGRTGVQAALGHAPGEDGRHRFVAFCLSHLGVDADGRIGQVQRRGMHRPSSACGALVAVHSRLLHDADASIDPDDVEMSLLRTRVMSLLPAGEFITLPHLTQLASHAAAEDLRRYVGLARGDEPVDVAYITGVVVHLPDVDVVACVSAHVVIDGESMELPH